MMDYLPPHLPPWGSTCHFGGFSGGNQARKTSLFAWVSRGGSLAMLGFTTPLRGPRVYLPPSLRSLPHGGAAPHWSSLKTWVTDQSSYIGNTLLI